MLLVLDAAVAGADVDDVVLSQSILSYLASFSSLAFIAENVAKIIL